MKIATALVLLALSIAPAAAWEQDGRTGTMFNDQSVSAPTPDQLAKIEATAKAIGCPFELDGDGSRYRGMGYKSWIWTGSDGKTHAITVYGADKSLDRCMPDGAQ